MMILFNLEQDIHDSNFFTFETSWIGVEIRDFSKNTLNIPLLNLEVQNKEVLSKLGFDGFDSIYIRESYFSFTGVQRVEKHLRIQQNHTFVGTVKEEFEFDNKPSGYRIFELGGMGVFSGYLYDGIFKIYANGCSFIVNDDSPISSDFISMNHFNPTDESWLMNFFESI